MDGIQGYSVPPRSPIVPNSSAPHNQPGSSTGTTGKTPSDYIRALRRRIWLVLAIGVPLSILLGIAIAYQPNVYSAKTQIAIEPPQFDPVLTSLVSNEVGHASHDRPETYASNHIAMLRSPKLAEIVVNDPSLTHGSGASEEAVNELIAAIQTRPIQGTNQYTVTLEGPDASRVAKSLQLLIDAFKDDASQEINLKVESSKSFAADYLKSLQNELADLSQSVYDMLKKSDTIGPGGKNIKEFEYESLIASIANDHTMEREYTNQAYITDANLRAQNQGLSTRQNPAIAELEVLQEKYIDTLKQLREQVRNFDSDPAAKRYASKLDSVRKKLQKFRALNDSMAVGEDVNPYEHLAEAKKEEIRQKESLAAKLLVEMQASMPTHQQYQDALEKMRLKRAQIADMETKIWQYSAISQAKKDPILQVSSVAEPTHPIRPKRAINMVFALFVSFGLGVGLVCLLEHIDHSVKAPEQLTAGLSLPLFGVIPRIRRSATLHRGGHLWTPGAPDSIEADAFRNLRASLLGVTDKRGPMVTLLVTSAKAGEGKSTTALNLAATCARAGERTLLMDVDLRRPSLAGVFEDPDEDGAGLGLVDVLRGDLPWQRTVVRTDIPNLDFLPTGDTTGIPIEILGALELRQLLIGLSSHYDRVILDGPAILGLADCRMLGRIVDASLLVVRSGSQELRPLQHAKAMLEQSHVVIAGVVFNGIYEDLKHWSSYGPETPYGYTSSLPGRSLPPTAGLEDASAEEPHPALPLASSSTT